MCLLLMNWYRNVSFKNEISSAGYAFIIFLDRKHVQMFCDQ